MENPMNLPMQNELTIARQAAQWLEILKSAGTVERTAFAKWIKESHAHLREFLLITALDYELSQIDAQRHLDVGSILAEPDTNVVSLNDRQDAQAATSAVLRPQVNSAWRRWPAAARAAALVVIAIGGMLTTIWLTHLDLLGHTYATDIGEQRAVELEDGSVIHVNTHSKVEVDYSAAVRDVRLLDGEALFKVAHDSARPFRVHVARNTIQAIGTQFNVYRQDNHTTVAVLEGLIQISADASRNAPRRVAAGERALIEPDGTVSIATAGDIVRATSWRQRRLTFRGNTLAEIAIEFNRYNRSSQLVVEGEQLRGREFTANFDADDPESLVEFLKSYKDIAIEKHGNEVLISPR